MCVILSSTEAEYVSLGDTFKEILFIIGKLNFMGMNIVEPIKVKVDNMGALFLAKHCCGKGQDTSIQYIISSTIMLRTMK